MRKTIPKRRKVVPITVKRRKTVKCTCGREITYSPHCKMCGSTYVYFVQRATKLVDDNGKKSLNKGYQCRKCGAVYNEQDGCVAPHLEEPNTTEQSRRATLAVLEGQPDFEQKRKEILEAVEDYKRRKKIN